MQFIIAVFTAKEKKMKLSNQALTAIMSALQKSLLEQTDIVPVLKGLDFVKSSDTKKWGTKNGELEVENPPTFNAVNIQDLAGDTEAE